MPNIRGREKTGVADALRRCKIGDSFLIDSIGRTGVYHIASCIGMRVATRNQGNGQHRVWRIK